MNRKRTYRMFKSAWSAFLAGTLLFSLSPIARAEGIESPVEQSQISSSFTPEMQEALNKAERLLYAETPFSDWAALGFARNGTALPEGYLTRKADELLTNRGSYGKISDLAETMIGYGSSGGNVNFIAGLDLYPILMNHPGMEEEGVYGLASAYVAGNHSSSNDLGPKAWYPDLLYYKMAELQLPDGSWPEAGSADGSVEATSAALASLNLPLDHESAKLALQWLKSRLSSDGGFGENTSATALAVIALSTLQADWATWVSAEGNDPLEFLLSRQLPDGGFSQTENGPLDMDATLQAYLALTSYKLFLNGGEKLLYGWYHPAAGSAMIQIEGPGGTVAQGRIQINKAGEAIETVADYLQSKGIEFKQEAGSDGSGKLVSIAGIGNGRFGGQDQWKLAVKSKYGSWMFEENTFEYGLHLRDGDQLLVYYGSEQTALIDALNTEWLYDDAQPINGTPAADTPFTVYVKKANQSFGNLPAPGVTVEIAGKKFVTDSEGKFAMDGLAPGRYKATITAYRDNAAPVIAKTVVQLSVSSPELAAFSDAEQVSEWARDDLALLLSRGYMKGVSSTGSLLAPKQPLTRAEFAVLLLRLMNETVYPAPGNAFTDVPAGKWYGADLAEAAALGITDRKAGAFEPERAVTREEAAVMTANAGRLMTYGSPERVQFNDIAGLSADSRTAIQAVFEHDIMKGSDGSFHPYETLVREQAASILARLHTLLYANTIMY